MKNKIHRLLVETPLGIVLFFWATLGIVIGLCVLAKALL